MPLPAPVAISLPDGLSVSGVTLWAVRLAGVLAARGRCVALLAHPEPPGQARLQIDLPPGVELVPVTSGPALRDAGAGLFPFIATYRDTFRRLARQSRAPVIYLPTLVGDSFALGAAQCIADPELLRIVGWQHTDIAYDARVLAHYEPVLSAMVGVSRRITEALAAALPARRDDIVHLPNAIPIGHAPPERPPARRRQLKLVYTGRLEQKQKRVTALITLSDELAAVGVDHTLTLVGDGPAAAEVRKLVDARARHRRITLAGVLPPDAVRALLRESDCFVLASRYEGLSIAMIEAMAEGCAPIVTSVASGASEVVTNGHNGLLVEVPDDADDATVGGALADAVKRFASGDNRRMGTLAWQTVRDSYSLDRYAERVTALLDRVTASPARPWPADRACAFTSTAGAARGSGTVPTDAALRLCRVLGRLSGRSVALHGAGRHTIELAGAIAASPARIVAITDDDPARWGRSLLGWPVIAPAKAASAGVTDVVISSWIHADEIFARRATYERQGIRVHHLYRSPESSQNVSYSSIACSN